MRRASLLFLLVSSSACQPEADAVSASDLAPAEATVSPTSEVNPFVGTDGHGHTHPAASLPFGMVQLGPDTRTEGWDSCGGYHYSDSSILGFSHTHLSGTGVADYNDVLVTPTLSKPEAADLKTEPMPFDHANEAAGPGWYEVALDNGVRAQMTATPRVGVHRYHFPAGATPGLVFDLEHRDEVLATELKKISDTEIAGRRRSKSWAQDQDLYFVARFSRPITEFVGHGEDATPLRAYLGFEASDAPLVVNVALSPVDIAGARKNLEAEAPHFDAATYREAADQSWAQTLGKIEIEGGSPAQRRTFYTALYHATLVPNLFSDVDGRTRGTDKQVHKAEGYDSYTVFSLWDTYRAAHPLFTIIERERTVDFIKTMLAHHERGGQLPMWELAANYTLCMIGYHAVPVIADAWAKGIRDFDGERALQAMLDAARADRLGIPAYRKHGHIPSEDEHESVSKTLEYAYDDWTIATMAAELGNDEVAATFGRRAQSWRNVFDPGTKFMRPRQNGGWWTPFDPSEVNFHFTEANSWQYSFYVPHDVPGMMQAMGGREAFLAHLDALFTAPSKTTGRDQADITGLIGQYAHGNEPSHHAAYLFAMAGQPYKTQARVRQILDTLYSDQADGLSGNEDCGQMSAWYVMSAMGLYAVAPGVEHYVLGAPLFPKTTIHLENGADFVIEAPKVSEANLYVQAVTLNGEPVERPQLKHSQILAGGTLHFEMGPEPNQAWGREGVEAYWTPPATVRAPVIESESMSFVERTQIAIHAFDGAQIHYTLDGSDPTAASPVYEGPLELATHTQVRAIAARDGQLSPPVYAEFARRPGDWKVSLSQDYNPQYTAGGPEGLADGLRGPLQWRAGRWQGYQGTDVEVVVDMGQARKLERVGAGFLQDAKSWIWMPTEVEFAISRDGQRFDPLGTVPTKVDPQDHTVQIEDQWVKAGKRARYIRVRAKTLGTIPEWHLGRGHQAFIFIDEVLVE